MLNCGQRISNTLIFNFELRDQLVKGAAPSLLLSTSRFASVLLGFTVGSDYFHHLIFQSIYLVNKMSEKDMSIIISQSPR